MDHQHILGKLPREGCDDQTVDARLPQVEGFVAGSGSFALKVGARRRRSVRTQQGVGEHRSARIATGSLDGDTLTGLSVKQDRRRARGDVERASDRRTEIKERRVRGDGEGVGRFLVGVEVGGENLKGEGLLAGKIHHVESTAACDGHGAVGRRYSAQGRCFGGKGRPKRLSLRGMEGPEVNRSVRRQRPRFKLTRRKDTRVDAGGQRQPTRSPQRVHKPRLRDGDARPLPRRIRRHDQTILVEPSVGSAQIKRGSTIRNHGDTCRAETVAHPLHCGRCAGVTSAGGEADGVDDGARGRLQSVQGVDECIVGVNGGRKGGEITVGVVELLGGAVESAEAFVGQRSGVGIEWVKPGDRGAESIVARRESCHVGDGVGEYNLKLIHRGGKCL